ncbi:MAG: hypothetical protein OHK0044_14800 [Burkholderiaceae bacterium]
MSWQSMTVRTIDLGYEQMLVFESRPGAKVRVLYGSVWLTEEGLPQDAIAGSGEEVALRARGAALLESLAPTRVEIVERVPNAPRLWRRLVDFAGALARDARRWRTRLQLGGAQPG